MGESETRVHFRVVRYIREAALKLHLENVPVATAATLYHRFFRENQLKEYDPFLIGATCLSLACKVDEQNVRLRDIINVCYRTLHKNKAPLEIGDMFWQLRESIAMCELYLLRALRFRVIYDHPHKYLCHYLQALSDWLEPRQWEEVPLGRTAWALLSDCYHSDLVLDHAPQHLAVSVLYLALQCHGVDVPLQRHVAVRWYKVFSPDISLDIIKNIITKVIAAYDVENQVPR